jgi:VCPO second helical-bundle domain
MHTIGRPSPNAAAPTAVPRRPTLVRSRCPGSPGRGHSPATTACLALALALTAAPAAAQNAVTEWDAVVEAAASAGRPPASGEYLHALVHLAVWDAVVSIRGGHAPYLGYVPVNEPASLDAAVAAAAYGVALARIPSQEPLLAAQLARSLAAIPEGVEKANGLAVGAEAARRLVAARAEDRFDAAVPFVEPPPEPGVFQLVAPPPAVDVQLKDVPPLLPREPDEYRPPGPPSLGSVTYATDLQEVEAYGRAEGGARTREQTLVARFWSENTFRQYARSLRELAVARGLDTFETSRFLTNVHLAAADALLACFEAKYHFLFWRPVHAIRRADEDGNALTVADPAWTPLLTVNHPEYPSAHSAFTSAVTHAVHRFFGTDEVPWTISSAATGETHTFAALRDIRLEVADARVWGGLHFRRSTVDGDRLGRAIEVLASRELRPSEDDGD